MSFFSRLFGKKSTPKPSNAQPNEANSSQPSEEQETKAPPPQDSGRDYVTPERMFHNLPDDVDMSGFKLAGTARIDLLLMMARMTGEEHPYEYINVLYEVVFEDGVIRIPLVVEKAGKKYGVFAYYSEEEAAHFKLHRKVLMERKDFGDCYYLSAYDPEKYTVEDGRLENQVTFSAVFRLDNNPKIEEYEGHYAMWWTTPEDGFLKDSPALQYYNDIFAAADQYESVFCGMLISALKNSEELQRLRLPEEERLLYTTGPENQKVLIALSQEKGMRFLLPREQVDAQYRNNLLKLIAKSMVFLRKGLEERGVQADPPQELSGKEWFDMVQQQAQKHATIDSVGGITIGNPPEPTTDRSVQPENLRVRVKVAQHTAADYQEFDIPEPQHPAFLPWQEHFQVGVVEDKGNRYEFVNNQMIADQNLNLETLINRGMNNVLNEIKENIRLHGDLTQGAAMITCGGNHESALILYDDFWNKIESMIQSDFCIALPVRDILYVGNFYNSEAMDTLRATIQKFYYAENPVGLMTNGIFLRKNGGWQLVEEVN